MSDGLGDLAAFIAKYTPGGGRQKILVDELYDLAFCLLQNYELKGFPSIIQVDATAVRVEASADSPARAMLCGFPNTYHPKTRITAGLTDGLYRENTSNVTMDFDSSTTFWGTEKASNWYSLYGVAGDLDTEFTLKGMPYCRVKSESSQVIDLGTHSTPATGIGYGWDTDSLVGYKIYFLSGASRGMLREISANNNDNSTGGTITYGGSALTVAAGDWFVILPATNFVLLGDLYNDSGSDISLVRSVNAPSFDFITSSMEWLRPPWSSGYGLVHVQAPGGGGGGTTVNYPVSGGGAGEGGYAWDWVNFADESSLPITIGAPGVGVSGSNGTAGGTTSFGSHLTATGGSPGICGNTTLPNGAGGAGGTPANGKNVRPGVAGETGDGGSYGGKGGDDGHCPLTGIGGARQTGNGNGIAGSGYGAGGGGAYHTTGGYTLAGGNGAPAVVAVLSF